MKKWLIAAAIFVIVVIVCLTVFVVVKLAPLGEAEQPSSEGTDSPAEYAREHYPEYEVTYDSSRKQLILEKKTDFSLESASSIYTETDTYVKQVRLLALDILSACDDSEIEVLLQYLSRDNEPMFSVSSTGEIVRYWEEDSAG